MSPFSVDTDVKSNMSRRDNTSAEEQITVDEELIENNSRTQHNVKKSTKKKSRKGRAKERCFCFFFLTGACGFLFIVLSAIIVGIVVGVLSPLFLDIVIPWTSPGSMVVPFVPPFSLFANQLSINLDNWNANDPALNVYFVSALPTLSAGTRRISYGSPATITNTSDFQTFGPLWINLGSTLIISMQYTSAINSASIRLMIMDAGQYATFNANPYKTLSQTCNCASFYTKSQDMFPTLTPYNFSPILPGLYYFVVAFNDDRISNRINFLQGNISFAMDTAFFSINPGAVVSQCSLSGTSKCQVPTTGWFFALLQQNTSLSSAASIGSTSAIRYRFDQDSGKWGGMIVGIVLGVTALGMVIGMLLFLIYLILSVLLPKVNLVRIMKNVLKNSCMCVFCCCRGRIESWKLLRYEDEEYEYEEEKEKHKSEKNKRTGHGSEKYYFTSHVCSLRLKSRSFCKSDREVVRKATKSALDQIKNENDQEMIRKRRKQLEDEVREVFIKYRTCSEVLDVRSQAITKFGCYSTSWDNAVTRLWKDIHIFSYILIDEEYAVLLSEEDRTTIEINTAEVAVYLQQVERDRQVKGEHEKIANVDQKRKLLRNKMKPIINKIVPKSEKIETSVKKVRECILSDECHTDYRRFLTINERKRLEEVVQKAEKNTTKEFTNVCIQIVGDVLARYYLFWYIRGILDIIAKEEQREELKKQEMEYRVALAWLYQKSAQQCEEKMYQISKTALEMIEKHNVPPPKKENQEQALDVSNDRITVLRSNVNGCNYIVCTSADLSALKTKIIIKLVVTDLKIEQLRKYYSEVEHRAEITKVISFGENQEFWQEKGYNTKQGAWIKLGTKNDNKHCIPSGFESITIASKDSLTDHETVFSFPTASEDQSTEMLLEHTGDNDHGKRPIGLNRHFISSMTKPGDIVLEWSDDESAGHTLNAALLEGRSCICVVDKQETRDYVMKRMDLLLNNDADLWEVRKKKSVAYGFQDPTCHCVCDCEDE
jgi:hypothetical protein